MQAKMLLLWANARAWPRAVVRRRCYRRLRPVGQRSCSRFWTSDFRSSDLPKSAGAFERSELEATLRRLVAFTPGAFKRDHPQVDDIWRLSL